MALPPAPAWLFESVIHLRVDTVNGCNLDCVFCHSYFSARTRHLAVEEFDHAVSSEAFGNLKQIRLGCAYEPLLGKHFEKYPGSIHHLKGRMRSEVVTNGILLDRRNISSWCEFGLTALYVSVYSHIESVYERTGRGAAKFARIRDNLLATRKKASLCANIGLVMQREQEGAAASTIRRRLAALSSPPSAILYRRCRAAIPPA